MRLIDADVAEKIIRDYADEVGCNRGEYELANGILKSVCKLEDVPTVEAVPVVRGEWINTDGYDEWTCSECGQEENCDDYPTEYGINFCSRCGADMRKKELDEGGSSE